MGLIGMMARTAVIAGTATSVSNRVSRRQANRWNNNAAAEAPPEQQYEQAPPPPPAPAQAPTGGSSDLVGQIEQLSALKNQGVLSDEEFSAAKAKLLGT